MTAEINAYSVSAEAPSMMKQMYIMSSGWLLHSFGPAEANDRSPTVTRRDGRTVCKTLDSRTEYSVIL